MKLKNAIQRDFPGSSVTKGPCTQCRGLSLIPGQGTRSHMPQIRICLLKLRVQMPQLRMPQLRPSTAMWQQRQTLFFGAPKSLQIVNVAMKLKDTYSLEEKL